MCSRVMPVFGSLASQRNWKERWERSLRKASSSSGSSRSCAAAVARIAMAANTVSDVLRMGAPLERDLEAELNRARRIQLAGRADQSEAGARRACPRVVELHLVERVDGL